MLIRHVHAVGVYSLSLSVASELGTRGRTSAQGIIDPYIGVTKTYLARVTTKALASIVSCRYCSNRISIVLSRLV